MSELTKIASILFRNLSDALLATASQLAKADSPLSQAEFVESPKLESLEIGNFVIVNYKKRRIGGNILAISDGGNIKLHNAVIPITVTVDISQVVYQRIEAYEIE